MEELYDKIERYLAGDLTEAEQADFASAIADDPELAAEVALHRQMQLTLADQDEWALRQSLQQLSNEEIPTEETNKKGNFGRNLFIGVALFSSLAAVWYYNQAPTDLPEAAQETEIRPPVPSAPRVPPPDTVSFTPEPEPRTQPAPAPSRPQVQRDPFEANPHLEGLKNTVGNAVYDLELVALTTDKTTKARQFTLNGLLYTVTLPGDSTLTWSVYDNDPDSYPESPLFTEIIIPKAQANDRPIAFAVKTAFITEAQRALEVAPGRFYYTISGGGELLQVGVFEEEE